MTKRLLFRREFFEYTGGHGKVFDYFRHADAHPNWQPAVHVTTTSTWDQNPWSGMRTYLLDDYDPCAADALFIAGMDWLAYPSDLPDKPVVNLIQHVRHATPGHPLREHLRRPAIRICVSQAVADAIGETGCVRGPVVVIDAAHDLPLTRQHSKVPASVFIDAIKQPVIGLKLAETLGMHVDVSLITQRLPRAEYLRRLATADIAVLLPHAHEGFYLPALEAMALNCAVVVPDCLGNRAYARNNVNASMPALDSEQIAGAVFELLRDALTRSALRKAGLETARTFTQSAERDAFYNLLERLDMLWNLT